MKARIYCTQRDNDRHFNQKLPTFRNGFCYIERNVTFVQDPSGVYEEGEYGFFIAGGKKIFVVGSGKEFEIE